MKIYRPGLLPRRLEEGMRALSYEPVIPSTWFATNSNDDMLRYATRVAEAASELVAQIAADGDEPLARQEADSVPRLMCDWRWKGFLPFLMDDETYVFRNSGQLDLLRSEMDALGSEIVANVRVAVERGDYENLSQTATYPINKGKSAPFWAPGTNRKAAAVLAAVVRGCSSVAEISEKCAELGATMPLCLTLYTRIQAAKKVRTLYIPDSNGGRVPVGSALLPKVRKVQAVPFLMNYPHAKVGKVIMDTLRTAGTGLLPEIGEVMKSCVGRKQDEMYGQDISNFDDSVGEETFRYVTDVLIRPVVEVMADAGIIDQRQRLLILDIERTLPTLELLGPPNKYEQGAILAKRAGGIVSGQRLTSVIGSFINNAQARTAIKMAGVSLSDVKLWTFGDDTLMVASADKIKAIRSVTESEEYAARSGFKSTRADDSTMLMRRMPWGYPYVCRMLLSTMQKEDTHEPRSLPVAALGIAARVLALRSHPYGDWYARIVSDEYFVGPRIAGAYLVARTNDFDVAKLSVLVENGVGVSSSGGSTAHTDDELIDLYEGLVAAGLAPEMMAFVMKKLVDRSAPSVAAIEEAASMYLTDGGAMNKPLMRKDLGL